MQQGRGKCPVLDLIHLEQDVPHVQCVITTKTEAVVAFATLLHSSLSCKAWGEGRCQQVREQLEGMQRLEGKSEPEGQKARERDWGGTKS